MPDKRKGTWAAGKLCEPYVDRWSRLVARDFLRWPELPAQLDWLDVGCGIGALTEVRRQLKFGVNCAFGAAPEYHLLMKVATGTVVKGTISVDDPEFKDGTDVFILTREPEQEVHLSPEELAELEAGIAEADRGEMVPGDEFFARLRRYG